MIKVKLAGHKVHVTPNRYPKVWLGIPENPSEMFVGDAALIYKDANTGEWIAQFYGPKGLAVLDASDAGEFKKLLEEKFGQIRDLRLIYKIDLMDLPKASERREMALVVRAGDVLLLSAHSDQDYVDTQHAKRRQETLSTLIQTARSATDKTPRSVRIPVPAVFKPGTAVTHSPLTVHAKNTATIRNVLFTGEPHSDSATLMYTFVKNSGRKGGALKVKKDTLLASVVMDPEVQGHLLLYTVAPLQELGADGVVLHHTTEGVAKLHKKQIPVDTISTLQPLSVEYSVPRRLYDRLAVSYSPLYTLDKQTSNMVVRHFKYTGTVPVRIALPVGVFRSEIKDKPALVVFSTSKPALQPPSVPPSLQKHAEAMQEYLAHRGVILASIFELPEDIRPKDKVKVFVNPTLTALRLSDQTRVFTGGTANTLFLIKENGKVYISGHHGFLTGDDDSHDPTTLHPSIVAPTKVETDYHIYAPEEHLGRMLHEAGFAALKEISIDDKIHDVAVYHSSTVPLDINTWKAQVQYLNTLRAFVFYGEKGVYIAFKSESMQIRKGNRSTLNTTEPVGKFLELHRTHLIHIPEKDAIVLPNTSTHVRAVIADEEFTDCVSDLPTYYPLELDNEAMITVLLPSKGKMLTVIPPKHTTTMGESKLPKGVVGTDRLSEMYPFTPGEIKVSSVDPKIFTDFLVNLHTLAGKAIGLTSPQALSAMCKR